MAGSVIHAVAVAAAPHDGNAPGVNLAYRPIARARRTAIRPKTFNQFLEEKYFLHLPTGTHALCTLCNPSITAENLSAASDPKLLKIGSRGRTWVAQHMKAKHADILCLETASGPLPASIALPKDTTAFGREPVRLVLTAHKVTILQKIEHCMGDANSVSMKLQNHGTTLGQAHTMFFCSIFKYEAEHGEKLPKYLAAAADFGWTDINSAAVKKIRKECLAMANKNAIRPIDNRNLRLNPENHDQEEDNVRFAMRRSLRGQRRNKMVGYVGLEEIPATSSLVEREFCGAGH